ncbi:hypothetical protein Mapa_010373 [Marchantia paleacea]|nr:hypothetical protein Mapa_010373 [Marchantia paleacea]
MEGRAYIPTSSGSFIRYRSHSPLAIRPPAFCPHPPAAPPLAHWLIPRLLRTTRITKVKWRDSSPDSRPGPSSLVHLQTLTSADRRQDSGAGVGAGFRSGFLSPTETSSWSIGPSSQR